MRVQRAPLATEQPQRPPPGGPAPSDGLTPELGGPFSAEVDLDLTRLTERLNRTGLLAEITVHLVRACHAERLIDDRSPLRVARLTDGGLVGRELDRAVGQSGYAIGAAFDAVTAGLATHGHRALTVLDLGPVQVRTAGDWGLGGVGVVTLGPAISTVVTGTGDSGLSLSQRRIAQLGFAVRDARSQATGVLRVLTAVAASIELLSR